MKMFEGWFDDYPSACMETNVRLFLLCGVWPLKTGERNLFFRAARILPYIALSACFLHFLVELYNINNKLGDFLLLAEDAVTVIFLMKTVLRIVVAMFKTDLLVGVVRQLNGYSRSYTDETEKEIFCKYRRRAHIFTGVYFAGRITLNFCFTGEPLLEEERRFPVHVQFPFPNSLESPLYEMLYFCTVGMGFFIDSVIASGDIFVVPFLIYLTGNFKILQHRLEHSREYATNNVIAKRLADENNEISAISQPLGCALTASDSNNVIFIDHTSTSTDIVIKPDVGHKLESTQQPDNMNRRSVFTVDTAFRSTRQQGRTAEDEESRIGCAHVLTDRTEKPFLLKTVARRVIEVRRETQTCPDRNTDEQNKISEARNINMEMDQHLDECVRFHIDLLSFAGKLLDEVNLMLFFEITVGAVVICIDMFEIVTVPSFSMRFYVSVCYLIINVVQIFSYCWAASELEHESELVSNAMYYSDWLEASKSFKDNMRIIMSRSVSPVVVRAATFLPFNLEVFTNIMNSGYSYFNIVVKMQKNR